MTLTKVIQALAALKDIDQDDVLGTVGLQRRRGMAEKLLTTLGIFGAGMVVGAGVGLLVSPVAPEDVRKRITEGAKNVKDEIGGLVEKGEEVASRVKSASGMDKNVGGTSSYKNGVTTS